MSNLHLSRQSAPQKHRGAWAEMVACVWLLQQGYEVFRNVSPHGGTDIVALKGSVVCRFDVKSYSETAVMATRTAEQIALGVQFLVIRDDGSVSISDGTPPLPSKIDCRQCGKPFCPSHRSQRLCSRECKGARDRYVRAKHQASRKTVQGDEISGGGIPVEIICRDVAPVCGSSEAIP